MSTATPLRKRPQRWQTPFGPDMRDADVERLLTLAPFHRMDADKFPKTISLAGILRNDTRLVRASAGEIVLREGDYGHSAFLVLNGNVRVLLKNLPRQLLGRASRPEPTLMNWWQAWSRWSGGALWGQTAKHPASPAPPRRIFLQDIPALLDENATALIGPGEVFGELAALTRTPRSATVIADGDVELLELRWQGLRDLLRYDGEWKAHVDQLYRDNSLRVHLRETPLFSRLTPDAIHAVAEATEFITLGNFDWQHKFRKEASNSQRRLLNEPVIAAEDSPANALLLIRNGFARVSRQCDDGHKTLSYLGKGDVFGLEELAARWRHGGDARWQTSLRAVGYVDVLRIPASVMEEVVLPTLFPRRPTTLPIARNAPPAQAVPASIFTTRDGHAEPGLLDFLVDHRLMNGTAAMVIDLDRCTRCDDCVRACAATHDGQSRFNRAGATFEHYQIAQACMHCVDPVCMIGCPTGAIYRDPDSGLIEINEATCIGCSTCAKSCPYDNINMVALLDSRGNMLRDSDSNLPILKATKCDLCPGSVAGPACVQACGQQALQRIDLHDIEKLTESWRA